MSGKKKKSTTDYSWENLRKPVRQLVYELVHGFAVSFIFLSSLATLGPFYALLIAGLSHTALGSVLSIGIGVFSNPVVSIAVAIIRMIDGELDANVSKGWYFVKAIIRAICSAGGSALAGWFVGYLWAGTFTTAILPQNLLAGKDVGAGFAVLLLILFENHVSILPSLSTDDGYGMMLSTGLAQFVFGIGTWVLWQVTPNLNFVFATSACVGVFTGIAGWTILVSVVAAALTIGLYYLFLNDVFATMAKNSQKASGLSDDVNTLLDNKADGTDNDW